MNKFQKGRYILKYPEKYVGLKTPTYRSGWEQTLWDYVMNILTYINGQVNQ